MQTEAEIKKKIEQLENVLEESSECGLASELGRNLLTVMINALKWVIEEPK